MGFGVYDSTSSLLLCQEDNISILGFDDDEEEVDEVGGNVLSTVFPLESDDCLVFLLNKEFDHLPRGDYSRRLQTGDLDISLRREAIDWIGKVAGNENPCTLICFASKTNCKTNYFEVACD